MTELLYRSPLQTDSSFATTFVGTPVLQVCFMNGLRIPIRQVTSHVLAEICILDPGNDPGIELSSSLRLGKFSSSSEEHRGL